MRVANRVGTAGRRKKQADRYFEQKRDTQENRNMQNNYSGKKSSRGLAKEGEGESIQLCPDQWHSNGHIELRSESSALP